MTHGGTEADYPPTRTSHCHPYSLGVFSLCMYPLLCVHYQGTTLASVTHC